MTSAALTSADACSVAELCGILTTRRVFDCDLDFDFERALFLGDRDRRFDAERCAAGRVRFPDDDRFSDAGRRRDCDLDCDLADDRAGLSANDRSGDDCFCGLGRLRRSRGGSERFLEGDRCPLLAAESFLGLERCLCEDHFWEDERSLVDAFWEGERFFSIARFFDVDRLREGDRLRDSDRFRSRSTS